jgi:hypothetical protein
MESDMNVKLNSWAAYTSSAQLRSGDALYFHDRIGASGPLSNVAGLTLPLYMNSRKAAGGITIRTISQQTLECVLNNCTIEFKPGSDVSLVPHVIPHHWIVVSVRAN